MSTLRLSPIVGIMVLIIGSEVRSADEPLDFQKEIARCAALEGSLERLSCYDELANNAGLDRPQPIATPTEGAGNWVVTRDINPIDDSERVVIYLTASSGRSSQGELISFLARCNSNKTEAYINWNDYLGDDSSDVYSKWKYVTIRIGDRKALRQRWGVSTDSSATFAPDWAGDLLKDMTTADTFLAQVTPYNEDPVTAIFDTKGMAVALQPLAEVCGWAESPSQ